MIRNDEEWCVAVVLCAGCLKSTRSEGSVHVLVSLKKDVAYCYSVADTSLQTYVLFDAKLVVEISKFRHQSTTFGRVLKVEAVDEVDDRFEAPKIQRVTQK